MRTFVALAIYVSLAAAIFAESPPSDWDIAHRAGLAALQRRDYAEAIEYFRRSWPDARNPQQQGISANDLGQTYRETKQPKQAQEWLERAYRIWGAQPGESGHLAITASSLADLYRDTGNYSRAEVLLREALAARPDNPDGADAIRNSLADLLREEGRSGEARALFEESLARQGISWEQRLNALTGLADVDRSLNDRDASERDWNQALALARARHDDRAEAIALRGLASMWLDAGNTARAEPLFRRSLAMMENNPAIAGPEVATALSGMARLYRAENKLALAEGAWTQALKLYRAAFGDLHPQVAWVTGMLADIYAQRGERGLAAHYATQSLDEMKCLFGENSPPTAAAFANRAGVEQQAHDLEGAARDYAGAIAIVRRNPVNGPFARDLSERYARLLKVMHRNREAKEISMLAAGSLRK